MNGEAANNGAEGVHVIPVSELTRIKKLGEGSFATVTLDWWQPKESKARQQVAVKRVKPHLLADPQELRLFLKEVETLRILNHRHATHCTGGYE